MIGRRAIGVAAGAAALAIVGAVLAVAPAVAGPPSVPASFSAVAQDLSAAQSDLAVAASVVAAQPTPTVTVTATATVTATPSPTPTPTSSPSSTRPGPSNTGVPAGTQLTVFNGDLTITTAGAIYSGLDIHGYVVVQAPNVTIRNSIVRGGPGAPGNGIVNDTSDSAPNFVFEDSEIAPAFPTVGLDGIKGWNYTALRDNIHGTVDGLKMYGPNATVAASWIHGLVTYAHDPAQGGGQSHNDGVQILSGSNLNVLGNTLQGGSNTAIQVTQDHGPLTSLLIDGNWATGGKVTFNIANKPLPALAGVTVTNNRFDHTASTGCQVLYTKVTAIIVAGNVFDDTGQPAKVLNTGSTT